MKAIDYLKFTLLSDGKLYLEYYKYLESICLKENFSKIAEFYAQQFTPELITKYFEGWEIVANLNFKGSIKIVNNDFSLFFSANKYFEIKLRINTNSLWYSRETFRFPRTLDDFINDVSRVGIELEFKQIQG